VISIWSNKVVMRQRTKDVTRLKPYSNDHQAKDICPKSTLTN
jgi:hypothetical protein